MIGDGLRPVVTMPEMPSRAVVIFIFPALLIESTLWFYNNGCLISAMATKFRSSRPLFEKPDPTETSDKHKDKSQTSLSGAQSHILSNYHLLKKVKEDISA